MLPWSITTVTRTISVRGQRRFVQDGIARLWRLRTQPLGRAEETTNRRGLGTRAKEPSEIDLEPLKPNQERLMRALHETCAFGQGTRWGPLPTETGMCRLALSDADKQARDWFVHTTRALGCQVTVDAMGNIFAVRPGKNKDAPPTFAGSHLDTQPSGGRYDGILGVLAGIEMLTLLRDHEVETAFPVGVVNWTKRPFPISMVSSGVWAGEIPLSHAHQLREVGGGATMKDELQRIGYLGSTPASYKSMPMAAHFELHIEQGPILEAESQKIGIVTGAQAYRWFTVDVAGREAHTGTTPFSARADALLLAARLITHSHRLAAEHAALASTGILTLRPGSVNTIPGHVRFSLDIRAPADATMDALEAALKRDFDALARTNLLSGSALPVPSPLRLSWRSDSLSPAAQFHPDCIAAVRASAAAVLAPGPALARDMVSGAGHDTVYASRRCPTAMIFVPCRRGLSHNPEEYATPEDCALGAHVLCQSVLRYDAMRSR